MDVDAPLPEPFAGWFASRGWAPRRHQLELLDLARQGKDVLLTAPTGGGKTLAGFLPSLIDLSESLPPRGGGTKGGGASNEGAPYGERPPSPAPSPRGGRGSRPHRLHTLYVSPLKALAVDVARNLTIPAEEMGLDLRVETRTGDTPPSRRQRQRINPPDILLTTPEQIALFCASPNAETFFRDLKAIVIDEIHALAPSKRGDLLALGLSAIHRWAPAARRVGLSATVRDPHAYARWLSPQAPDEERMAELVTGDPGRPPEIDVLISENRVPWSGHTGAHAMKEVYQAIKTARTAIVFVNTRAQAELTFHWLWDINEDGLPIALHHGSLDVGQRRKVEAAMAEGRLRAVVATSTLDMGIDWGDVDLVLQMGAPKGSSRLLQRIGRANHRLDDPSRAVLVPYNRFEALECDAAQGAVSEGALDGEVPGRGSLDILAQHVMGRACGEPFETDALYSEITTAGPYADLTRERFGEVMEFVATGGYALKTYDRFRRIVKGKDGLWRARNNDIAQRHRMNVGAIVEAAMLNVRLARKGGRAGMKLGEIEEWFIEQLAPGDSFLFSGQVLEFVGLRETDALVVRSKADAPKIPSYMGGKFPLTTYLAERVRGIISSREDWRHLPVQVREWLEIQEKRSLIPEPGQMLVETFPRADKHYLVAYPFDGRLAHQTLGMLLTRRLERLRLRPMGFVANEYALAVWGLRDLSGVDLDALFHPDMLGDDLDAWLQETPLMKRTFRNCAVIAGLIERRFPGQEKTGRQVTFSADLIYDVLRTHQPDHILLQAAYQDAASGLLDIRRLSDALARIRGHIVHQNLEKVSPLAVPVMMEIGRESVFGEANEALLAEVSESLIEDATS